MIVNTDRSVWVRLDESRLRNIGGDGHSVKRVYGASGQKWPRLTISTYRQDDGFTLGCSQKDGPSEWWSERDIPAELLREAAEVLIETAAKSAGGKER